MDPFLYRGLLPRAAEDDLSDGFRRIDEENRCEKSLERARKRDQARARFREWRKKIEDQLKTRNRSG